MTTRPIIHTIASNGRVLTAELEGDQLVLFLDAKRLGPFVKRFEPVRVSGIVITHRAGNMDIRQVHGEAIEAAWQSFGQAQLGPSPIGRAKALQAERASLAARLDSLREEEYTLRAREIARGGRMTIIDMSGQIGPAQAALDAFDAEHPEILDAIRAKREAMLQENIRAAENA